MDRGGFSCMLVFLFAIFSAPAFAASQPVPYATVAVVQMPAWLERDGRRQPLAIGMEVRNGDRILTGADARAYLKLAEGSSVKLGENAALGFYSRSLKPASKFKGAFDVRAGALRFTASRQAHSQRDVTLRVGTTSVSVHSADMWGKANAERDQILLIEGRVELKHGDQVLEMGEPLTIFSVARNTGAQEVASADPGQLRQWTLETEVLAGHGATQPGGKWRVLLARASSQKEALAIYDTARAAGYAAQVKVKPAGDGNAEGQWNYDVVVLNLASQQEAAALADKISRKLAFAAKVDK